MLDTAVLILRLVLGLVLLAHAAQKSLGWFGGNGLRRQGTLFESLGLRPGMPMVLMATFMETVAALGLMAGLLTPVAALIAAATMTVAALTLNLKAGAFWNSAGGGEYPFILAFMALSLGLAGGGSYSLDSLLLSSWPALSVVLVPSAAHALALPVLVVLSALPFIIRLRMERGNTAPAPTGREVP